MAAILSSSIGDTDSVVKFINEARELGIEVLPPDVNESGYKFTVLDAKRIRFGLGAIRNVGRGAIDSVLSAHRAGPFESFFDFTDRVDLRACNKRVFEALIASGALDGLGGHRAQYWSALDAAMQESSLKQQEREMGQVSMFGGPAEGGDAAASQAPHTLPNVAPMAESERLTREKEILGFYISGHPLEPYRVECELFATHTVSQLGKWTSEPISMGVVVTAIKRQISKRSGAEFARLTVEDFSGSSEVLVFPESWGLLADRVRSDVPVLMKGGYSKRDQDADSPTFIVESVTPFAELRLNGQVSIAIELALGDAVTAEVMGDVRAVIDAHATPHSGAPPLELRWNDGNGTRARLKSRTLRLAATQAALTDLRALLGTERVRLVRGS
jgi:DNA polymerase-3 subunit alpha